jgi:hypothetical protein
LYNNCHIWCKCLTMLTIKWIIIKIDRYKLTVDKILFLVESLMPNIVEYYCISDEIWIKLR